MNTDMIAFEAELRRLRGAYIFDIAPAIEMYRALLTRVEVLDVAFANSHQLNESLGDENRALLARVEAAEALAAERLEDALFAEQRATDAELERDDAILAASDAERHAENAMHGLAHFRARVAELEAEVARLREELAATAVVWDEATAAAVATWEYQLVNGE